MIIKNLTPKTQMITIESLTGLTGTYEVYLAPHGVTDIEGNIIANMESLKGIISIVEEQETILPDTSESTVVAQQEMHTPITLMEEVKEEEVHTDPDNFTCEVCGAEFASARGLASHMNRAHANK